MDSICRSCCAEHKQLFSFFESFVVTYKEILGQIFSEVTNITLSSEDNLPLNICEDCIFKLNNAYEFRRQSQNANEYLKQCIISSNNHKCFENSVENKLNIDGGIKENSLINDHSDDNAEYNSDPDNCIKLIEECTDEIEGKQIEEYFHDDSTHESVDEEIKESKNKVFEGYGDRKKHKAINEDNISCPICGKIFKTKINVNIHIRAIHDKEKRLTCEDCGKKYFYRNSLKVHRLRHHLKIANFVCDFCGKFFFAAGDLRVHKRKHNGDMKYKCTIEGCSHVFTQSSQLKFHVNSKHTGHKTFSCNKCDKSFYTRQHLKEHSMRKHHEGVRERTHFCDICGNGFFNRFSVSKHKNRIHRNMTEIT